MRRHALIVVLAAGQLAGCAALGGGDTTTSTATHPSKLQQAQSTHEYPSPPPPPERANATSATAEAAVAAFAGAYINWTADNVTARMQQLAANSIGQARSAMALAAAQTAGDYELKNGGVANRGTVEAVTRLPGRENQYVVVTREQTTATNTNAYAGLRPSWHVALASVARLGAGWVVSRWQPEN